MASQAERRAATRARIVESARRLFVERGFDDTTTAMILDDAGVSRGAMYHHFSSKEEVFAAVFEAVTKESIADSVVRPEAGESPMDALIAGCLAWLDDVSRPEVATILLEQGPAVLGWKRCRDIDDSQSLRLMSASVRAAVVTGEIETSSVELTARIINAALSEMALALVHQPGERIDRDDARSALTSLLKGLAAG